MLTLLTLHTLSDTLKASHNLHIAWTSFILMCDYRIVLKVSKDVCSK